VQYTTTPKPNETSVAANTPIRVAVVDGSATVVTNTIQLRLNNQVVSPSVASDAATAGLTKVDFQPAGGLPSGSTNSVRLTFNDSSGAAYDEQWSFVVAGNLAIPGLYAVEAEHFAANVPYIDPGDINSHTWELTTNSVGFSGEGAMVAEPNVNFNANVDTTVSPRLDYNMNFTIPGTYFVWVRALADSAPGPSQSDSVNVGIDGVLPASQASAKISGFPPGGFVWSRTTVAGTPATIVVPSTGPHVVNVWMREDGFIFDKLLFTTNNAYVPTGFGPLETTTVTRPELSYTVSGKELNVSWTGGGVLESAAEVTGPYLPAVEGSVSPVSISININVSRRFFRVVR
jgi:hypothetical protein